ncbi:MULTISPECIES: SDR family NAD(P)-dependent oxidoreductase [Streptomyces]|uniref:SDR family NAD(P)-dependent oxidoreductase n=1 Tax=Streptomyces TaxID=1883 RepID=UPI000F77B46E|nr:MULTISPECIES: SDR family NAD(P)-dependent oxidoreductase [Streptomyces]RST06860.1 SDR family NAD(P)-dependent oxidoreductase [Streptomyces sp. WAC07149]GLX17029.1 oxidoreductase [Streptomyces lavendulae subsp. lavendulae]GLX29536.1 oxidoreductase [Streptomyces lavendulae subsp. lavendulae]
MTQTRELAIVTGASGGIGFELARQLADRGFDLIVNSADEERLRPAAEEIRRRTGASVEYVRADLRRYEEAERFLEAVAATGRPVAVAALNAGVGQGGAFLDTDLEDEFEIVDLNVRSTVHLAKRLLRSMAAAGAGRMLITSSIASTTPGSFQAVYNASKSFLQSFSQALQNELEDTPVTVTALMPGPTDTDFFRRADMEDTKVGSSEKDDPGQVAEQGLDALFAGKDKVVAGSLKTRAQGMANKILPDSLKAEGHRRMAEPGSAEQ